MGDDQNLPVSKKLPTSRKEAMRQGTTRYFTGKPCKHGHIAERLVSTGACDECKKAHRPSAAARRERRYESKRWAIEYKGGKCAVCSYDKCAGALDFHHVTPGTKEFEPADMLNNSVLTTERKTVLRKELDKCILVCSNCHREIHDAERTS